MSATVLLVHRISLGCDEPAEAAFAIARARLRPLGVSLKDAVFSVYRKSIDARKRDHIRLVYSVAVKIPASVRDIHRLAAADVGILREEMPALTVGTEPLAARPVVVGTGPCGLFCALTLAEGGYAPILLERGGTVAERRAAVDRFHKTRILDTSTNVQFGAGGAGTFSDGKLVTRISDPLTSHVLRTFVAHGAPETILTAAKPHIGTDILSAVVDRMLAHIVALGGEVRYHTTFLGFESQNGRITCVHTDHGDLPCGALVLATGHSARDTYAYLLSLGLAVEAKSFSVGMRIEHKTRDIDEALFGSMAGHPALGHAEYALSHNTSERGVYTFCMCPGGTVVAATSEEEAVVVNGMSEHLRDGENSNAAVLCSIFKEDYGESPAQAIALQRSIEHAAFVAGDSSYATPLTTVGDFLSGVRGTEPSRILPTYMDGQAYTLSSPEEYLPTVACRAIAEGLFAFDKKIRGFAAPDAILSGAETRTSAPLRLLRDKDTRLCLGYENLYPAGEGAGYAGGITSASVDGIHTARAIIARFAPLS